jgi:hypothetical protein
MQAERFQDDFLDFAANCLSERLTSFRCSKRLRPAASRQQSDISDGATTPRPFDGALRMAPNANACTSLEERHQTMVKILHVDTRRPEERAQLARSYAPLAQATPLANAKRRVWKPRGTVSEARGLPLGALLALAAYLTSWLDAPTYRSWGRKLYSVTRQAEQNTRKTVDAIRWPRAASGVREHLQLKDRFKKSLSW